MTYRSVAAGLLTALCLSAPIPTHAAGALGVKFSWAATPKCSATPPAFRITHVPKGTKFLSFRLVDHDAEFHHGGGEVSYNGDGDIPAGAFGGDYRGPCPPPGAVHTYEWTVYAMDANGGVLAEGKAAGKFPAK